MPKKQFALIFAVVMLAAATTVGFTCEKADKAEQKSAEHKCWATEHPEEAAQLADLAVKAEGGCAHSKAALIAKMKESGCEETAALAAKAEGGSEESTAALIAKAKEMGECAKEAKAGSDCGEMDVATLAAHAEQGCAKSKAALIAWAKEHGCEKSKELAAKAEGGCEKSMQELIAMAKEHKEAKTE